MVVSVDRPSSETASLDGTTVAPNTTTIHAIVNPAAGSGRAGKRWPRFLNALERAGFAVSAHLTTGPGDATTIARQLAEDGATTILCVGGDGTTNEVVNGLVRDDLPVNPRTRLALVPCGTGRDLARSLGTNDIVSTIRAISGDPDASTVAIDVARVSYIDPRTGYLATRYCANVADTGIGAATAALINSSSKTLGGLVSYFTGAVRSIIAYSPWDVIVEADGERVYEGSAGMVVFANGRYFAGGMQVAPMASLCDGRLEMFVLEGVGKRQLLTSLLPRVYRGKHVGEPGVVHRTVSDASVRSDGRMLLEMDGEQVGGVPVTVDVVPRVLRIVVAPEVMARSGSCTNPDA
mgnify:CR=1 FL=1